MNLEKKYPCVADMERTARHRIPGFMRDYLFGGLGNGISVRRNREALDNVVLMPRYLADADQPAIDCTLLGRDYDAPFGVAPLGLSGLVWPRSEFILAAAAKAQNVPYTLSTVSTAKLEEIRTVAGENGWFQLYTPRQPEVLEDLLGRCQAVGYDTLLVTVDVPVKTRREHDIRNGLSVPPKFDLRTLAQMIAHPGCSLRMLRSGVPRFVNLEPYSTPQGANHVGQSIQASSRFIRQFLGDHITAERFKSIRALWPGKLLVKGVLDVGEARQYLDLGADGLVVSNHGGRQLDAAPTAVSVLPQIREAVGPDVAIIADGGIRSGLDIARMLALGADFVLLGRPFLFALAALDIKGGEHVMHILKAELVAAMGQIGCRTLEELPGFLHSAPGLR